jgi:hypothetical protein
MYTICRMDKKSAEGGPRETKRKMEYLMSRINESLDTVVI